MKVSNWGGFTDLSHPNFTGRTPRTSKYDGVGGWAKDSSKIPASAWLGAAVVVALFIGALYLGAVAGY